MNRLMIKKSAKRLTLLAVAGLVCTQVSWAQTPPSWLDWNGKSDTNPAATAQAAPAKPQAATVRPLAPQPPVSQPLGSEEAGAIANSNTASGRTVIIQNLLDSVSRLQEQVRDLRGQNEVQENQIQRLKKAQQSAFSSFDDRLSKLEHPNGSAATTNSPNAPVPPTPPSAQAPVTPTPATPVPSNSVPAASVPTPSAPVPSASTAAASTPAVPGQDAAANAKQQALYNAAFTQLKNGQYDQAISGFQAAIDADPQGQWTPSALFWQGETYYVEQKRAKADAAYQKVLSQFPNSDRVPDALLKTGYIAYDENKNKQARAIFQQVISKYPKSQAANLAKQRLARMDAEKR